MDLQKYNEQLKTGFNPAKTLLSCDWLEFRISGKLDQEALRSLMGSNYKIKSSATYQNIIEFPDYSIMWGVRGLPTSEFIHVKFNNEFLYSMNYTNPYRYFEVIGSLFKCRNVSKSYIARMDICCDMPFDSDEYKAIKQRFDTNTIGTYPRRKVCQALYKQYALGEKYKLHYATGECEDLSKGVDPISIKQTKRYNNRGCIAFNYSAGSRQGDFYFRFYDKTLENEGVSDIAKKEYIKAIHDKYLPNSQRVYRLECEVKLPYLPITCATFDEIARDLFGYYFGTLPYEGFLFRPEFGRKPQNQLITSEKKMRLCNAIAKYMKVFPERKDLSCSELVRILINEIKSSNGVYHNNDLQMTDSEDLDLYFMISKDLEDYLKIINS